MTVDPIAPVPAQAAELVEVAAVADAPAVDVVPVANRIKRAQGQLGGVLRMVEEGRDVEDVVNQLRAVVRALDRAALALVAVELRARLADPAGLGEDEIARLEKLLLSVA